MTVDPAALGAKVREMYPEIGQYNLDMDVFFDKGKNAWIVKLTKGDKEQITHVEPKDAEECLKGVKCMYLGHQIGQFIRAYCLGKDACHT